jgi:hypothetical protein
MIDKHIPRLVEESPYSFALMEKGDSFFTKQKPMEAARLCRKWSKRLRSIFIARPVIERGIEGTRIWKIK